MKVACIFLNHNRSDLAIKTINHNFYNSGYNADVFLVDNGSEHSEVQRVVNAYNFKEIVILEKNIGVSGGLNQGIFSAKNYDAVVTLANDILMPENWLSEMVRYAQGIPETGTVGIHCVESIGATTMVHGLPVQRWAVAFGNVLIPMGVINKIGYFNTDFDPYSVQDADFAYRAEKAGFIHYYIPGMKSEHIGHDVGNGTEYRKMKDESLAKAAQKSLQWKGWYKNNGVYLPYDQEEVILNKNQFYGEA